MALKHIFYASAARNEFTQDDLILLLKKAQEKNTRLHVTGILLHCDNAFFQVIEGEADTVEMLFNTIANDPRHESMVRIIDETIHKRDFSLWTMGFARTKAQELETIIGTNDFFQEDNFTKLLTAGRARKVLEAFKKGRWHISKDVPR